LLQDGFFDLVRDKWNSIHLGLSPVKIWQQKIIHFRQFLRGWAKNLSGVYKKEKERLTLLIDELNLKAETTPLCAAESAQKKGG
jgi:hypothetical protein